MKAELDPRRCGTVSAPTKTTTVPRAAQKRTRENLRAAATRASDGPSRKRVEDMLSGARKLDGTR